MTVGDQATSIETVIDDASMTIQPAGTSEYVIHNIYVPVNADIELYKTNGTLTVRADINTGSLFNFFFHASNTDYITVKNVSGGTIEIAYDGTVTKV